MISPYYKLIFISSQPPFDSCSRFTIYMNVINNKYETNQWWHKAKNESGEVTSKLVLLIWIELWFFFSSATINYVLRNLIYINYNRSTFRYSAFGFFFLFSFPFISIARWIDRRKPHEMPWNIQIEVNKREWKKVFDVQRRKSRLFRIVEEKKMVNG